MMIPPKAEKRPYPITIHGDTRVDDYYWLRVTTNVQTSRYWTTYRRKMPIQRRC